MQSVIIMFPLIYSAATHAELNERMLAACLVVGSRSRCHAIQLMKCELTTAARSQLKQKQRRLSNRSYECECANDRMCNMQPMIGTGELLRKSSEGEMQPGENCNANLAELSVLALRLNGIFIMIF